MRDLRFVVLVLGAAVAVPALLVTQLGGAIGIVLGAIAGVLGAGYIGLMLAYQRRARRGRTP